MHRLVTNSIEAVIMGILVCNGYGVFKHHATSVVTVYRRALLPCLDNVVSIVSDEPEIIMTSPKRPSFGSSSRGGVDRHVGSGKRQSLKDRDSPSGKRLRGGA